MEDTLARLFTMQHDLQTDAYGHNFQRMLPADRIQFIKEMKLALEAELQEALDETGWKPWATSRHINRDAYVGELVDALHFFMNMLLVLGDDPEMLAREVFIRYIAKHTRNAERQAEGYDGVSGKCRKCSRALDDLAVECYISDGGTAWCAVYGKYMVIKPIEVVMTPIRP